MKNLFITILVLFFHTKNIVGQSLYFPPFNSSEWETMSLSEANYNQWAYEPLINFLTETETKGFLILQDGKIVVEEYLNDFSADKNWYWASAGKTLTSTIVGIAQQEGYLNINDFTSNYLGDDWTSCSDEKITIFHQLSMTTGLDYSVENNGCTQPDCLLCLNEPGTEWYYHNAPYTLLDKVIENAVSSNYNQYTRNAITNKIGMDGFWLRTGDNNLYWSTPRSMARFGLMSLAKGKWENETIINEDYHHQMVNTSQEINPSYGLLWWLNGKDKFRLPSSTITFNGPLVPNAPLDMYAALGKNSQICMVIPSLNMVVIRMGNDPDESPVPVDFIVDLWDKIEDLIQTTSTEDQNFDNTIIYPNPVNPGQILQIEAPFILQTVNLKSLNGSILESYENTSYLKLPSMSAGIYLVEMIGKSSSLTKIIIVH